MTHDRDTGYRFLFSNPERVRDRILGFIPDEWRQSLDCAPLEKVSGSYVREDFRQRADDVVWPVRVGANGFIAICSSNSRAASIGTWCCA